MLRPVAVALCVAIGLGAVRADEPMWIDSVRAQPWRPALQAAADRTQLPVSLLAELIGVESGFRPGARCPTSSAAGMGQQIKGNRIMARHRLNRMVPAESIMGSALELRENLDKRGATLSTALRDYGTTAGMSNAKRRATDRRMEAAARHTPLL